MPAHDPVVNPSVHYLGVEGNTTIWGDHSLCEAQNERIKAERSDEYGPDGAYNFQGCNSHGIRMVGRGWDRSSAANGGENGIWYNDDSRALCILVGVGDEITPQCEAMIRAFANEAVNDHGMQWPLRGHSEFVATSCPGDHLREVVARVNANHGGPAPTPPTPEEEPLDMYIVSDPSNKADKYLVGEAGARHIKSIDEYKWLRGGAPYGGQVKEIPTITQAWFDSLPKLGV